MSLTESPSSRLGESRASNPAERRRSSGINEASNSAEKGSSGSAATGPWRAVRPRESATEPAAEKARAYQRVRFRYDARRSRVWQAVAAYLQRFVDKQAPLLELGAGYGDFIRFACASRKWALEINAGMADHWGPEVEPLIQSALDSLPLEGASVQTVFASNFFEHFTHAEIESILVQVLRVLRPGGRLIVVQPNFRLEPRRYFDDYTHRTIFTDSGFADFLRSLGWTVEHQEGRFLPFSMRSRLPVSGALVTLYLALPFRPLAGQFLVVAKAPDSSAA